MIAYACMRRSTSIHAHNQATCIHIDLLVQTLTYFHVGLCCLQWKVLNPITKGWRRWKVYLALWGQHLLTWSDRFGEHWEGAVSGSFTNHAYASIPTEHTGSRPLCGGACLAWRLLVCAISATSHIAQAVVHRSCNGMDLVSLGKGLHCFTACGFGITSSSPLILRYCQRSLPCVHCNLVVSFARSATIQTRFFL